MKRCGVDILSLSYSLRQRVPLLMGLLLLMSIMNPYRL
jgi:hypothetical protein